MSKEAFASAYGLDTPEVDVATVKRTLGRVGRPTILVGLGGFAYYFWNGACFGITFALGRFNRPVWWPVPCGAALGVSFLLSPAVQGLGIGIFGANSGWHFAVWLMKKSDVSHHCRDCTKMISAEEVFRGILYLVDVAGAGTTPL